MGAGTAKTSNFMLATASVMIGAQDDLYDLNPAEHSVGLVKNFSVTSEPEYTELTQGVKNTIVSSVMTSNPVNCAMEVYEYTAKNLTYAVGLNGNTLTSATAAESTVDGAVPASPAQSTIDLDSATGFTVGDTIIIRKDEDDDFVVRTITAINVDELTVDRDLPAIPDGVKVTKVNTIDVGSKDEQPYLSAKVAGKLSNGQPIVLLYPKVRITRGFNMNFSSDDYGNLPFEFTIYDLVGTDTYFQAFDGASSHVLLPS